MKDFLKWLTSSKRGKTTIAVGVFVLAIALPGYVMLLTDTITLATGLSLATLTGALVLLTIGTIRSYKKR